MYRDPVTCHLISWIATILISYLSISRVTVCVAPVLNNIQTFYVPKDISDLQFPFLFSLISLFQSILFGS